MVRTVNVTLSNVNVTVRVRPEASVVVYTHGETRATGHRPLRGWPVQAPGRAGQLRPANMYCCTVVVLPAADADQVPQNSIAACAEEIRPVDRAPPIRISWFAVARVPDATADIRSSPFVSSDSPVGPTA